MYVGAYGTSEPMTFLRTKSHSHDVVGFFQAKNHIQVVSFSSCDKMANCRELVACAVCCIRRTNAHRVHMRVCMHMGSAYALSLIHI